MIFRLSRVCRLWWQVSTGPLLWHTVDLATGRVKEKHRTERKLFWLLQNRLSRVQDLALGNKRITTHFDRFNHSATDCLMIFRWMELCFEPGGG